MEKIITGVAAVEANLSHSVMALTKIPDLHPKNSVSMKVKQFGYVHAKKLATHLIVTAHTVNCNNMPLLSHF